MSFWWSFVMVAALVLALAACDSPSMAFRNIPAAQTSVAGATFSVRHTEYEAEAIRINTMWPPPRRRDMVIRGVAAIEQISGCAVVVDSVRGDTNLVAADIACMGASEALRPKRAPRLDCVGFEGGGRFNDGLIDITCDVVR